MELSKKKQNTEKYCKAQHIKRSGAIANTGIFFYKSPIFQIRFAFNQSVIAYLQLTFALIQFKHQSTHRQEN